jgi:hypothetical protein
MLVLGTMPLLIEMYRLRRRSNGMEDPKDP